MSLVCFLSILFYFNIVEAAPELEEYGPYNVQFLDYKVIGSTDPELSLEVGVDCSHGHCSGITHNFTFHSPIVFEVAKVDINRIQKGQKLQILRKTLLKPCTNMYYKVISHFIPLFRDNFKETKGTCVMNKGNFVVKVDMTGPFGAVLGPRFYYGDYVMRSSVTTKRKIVYNLLSHFKFEKRNN